VSLLPLCTKRMNLLLMGREHVRMGIVGCGVLSHPQDTRRGLRFGLERVAILKGAIGVGGVTSHPIWPEEGAYIGFWETR